MRKDSTNLKRYDPLYIPKRGKRPARPNGDIVKITKIEGNEVFYSGKTKNDDRMTLKAAEAANLEFIAHLKGAMGKTVYIKDDECQVVGYDEKAIGYKAFQVKTSHGVKKKTFKEVG
jgi:hypothetical protein